MRARYQPEIDGLRAVADFEYEYQMAGMNQQINPRVETVFLMADVALQPIASRLVKEIALFGGDIEVLALQADRRHFILPSWAEKMRSRARPRAPRPA